MLPASIPLTQLVERSGGSWSRLIAVQRRAIVKAICALKSAAIHGGAGAQYNLGYMYDQGRRDPQSDKDAAVWYRKAATKGMPTRSLT